MTAGGRRVSLRIDRIVCDRPGLERAGLEAALRREVAALLARRGDKAPTTAGECARLKATLPRGAAPTPAGVARAALGAVARPRGGGS